MKSKAQNTAPPIKKISPMPADLNLIDDIQKLMSQPAIAVQKLSSGSMFNHQPTVKCSSLLKSEPPSIPHKP